MRAFRIPWLASIDYEKCGVYDYYNNYRFHFTGVSMDVIRDKAKIKWGSTLLQMEQADWQTFSQELTIPVKGKYMFFWVRNSDSTGKWYKIEIK